jgi:hypothetical protein
MIKTIRSYLDTGEAFLQDRQELVDHLRAAHKLGPSCVEAKPASLNRRHWRAHGSDLASLLGATRSRGDDRQHREPVEPAS